jgi:hypothetical protein
VVASAVPSRMLAVPAVRAGVTSVTSMTGVSAVQRDDDIDAPTNPRFEDAEPFLLCLLADAVEAGHRLAPTLLAFSGERPLGSARLRPHEPGQLATALLEVLALLLPLGADRLVLALPGRAWSLADPIPPVADEADLRQRVVVVVTADAHRRPCRLRTRLHPFDVDERGRCCWLPQIEPGSPPEAPILAVLRVLLDHRDDVTRAAAPGTRVAAQFGRVLLLGHALSLAPQAAEALLTATAATP